MVYWSYPVSRIWPLDRSEEKVPMASLVREIINEIDKSKYANKHNFTVDVDDDAAIYGSSVLMQSVISNLVYNAIHHTPEDTNIDIYWGGFW